MASVEFAKDGIDDGKDGIDDGKDGIGDGKIEIAVNDKPVVLDEPKQTGASIKKAAIEQDVNIKEDFVLSRELGGGKTELVGDDDFVEVHLGDRFVAIENDDNS